MPVCANLIPTASRASRLAKLQVVEVLQELRHYYPEIAFQLTTVATYGDKDKITSLKTLGASDFFTREVDALLLSGECRIAIHSAKDLLEPLTEGLEIVAFTRSISTRDVLVLRAGDSLATLPQGAKIATSSLRREEMIRSLAPEAICIDIRGTIEERLAALTLGRADGVVIAEAALLRLALTDLNQIPLSGPTAKYQGQLAIIACKGDREMQELFSRLDVRQEG